MFKRFFFLVITSFILSMDSMNAIEIKESKKISDDIKIGSLSEQYKKQESSKYDELNKCVELVNSATYVDSRTWKEKDYLSPKKILITSDPDGKEYFTHLINFNYIELRGLQVFN